MSNTRPASILAAAVLILGTSIAFSEDQPADPAQELFLKYRCNSCHTMKSHNIEKKASKDDEPAKKGDRKSPDLSGVSKTRTVAFITKYMMKQEKIEGETHRKKFRGTPDDLKTIATWLGQQKVDLKGKEKEKEKEEGKEKDKDK